MDKCRFFFLFIAFAVQAFSVLGQHSVIFPQPNKIGFSGSDYLIGKNIRFHGNEEIDSAISVIRRNYSLLHEVSWEKVPVKEKADITFISLPELKKESYKLIVDSGGIQLYYGSYSGLLYGLGTLEQTLTKAGDSGIVTIPGYTIEDEPAFAYRGIHLDCSRHFFEVEEIKQLLDQAAVLKLNRFHWHLTDDQGWRIEIRKYPKLTEIGAWRDSTLTGHFSSSPQQYKKKRYGGFYTQDEAKDIVAYAARLGITVIPEIEMPGHARAALAAYPELGCTGERLPVAGTWGVFDDIFCSKDETREFLKNVLDEIMEIFPSEVIHIGGDEAPKVRWDACPRCAKVKKAHSLKDSHELQSFFIQDIENFVYARGRKIIGWDEILEGGLAKNAQVMSWRGTEGGIAAAKQGHDVVMTPTAFCYLDYYQSGRPDEPLAIGGFLTLEKVYSFNPVPEGLTEQEKKHIIGGQANLWTEYISDLNGVHYAYFPRLIAISEVLWTRNKPSYADFVDKMATVFIPRLVANKVNFSKAFLEPKLETSTMPDGIQYMIKAPLEKVTFSSNDHSIGKIELNRTKELKDTVITVGCFYEGEFLNSMTYRFRPHSLIGLPVVFITPPDPKYDNRGTLALTDGVIGARPWKGDQWLGFSNDTVQFVIDLGENRTLGTLELGTLNDPGSWIHSPRKIIAEGGDDGKTFKKLSESAIDREMISIEFKSKARFLKITLINNEFIPAGMSGAGTTPWTFIDELILR